MTEKKQAYKFDGRSVLIEPDVFASQAFRKLTGNEIRVLLRFMQKREWDKKKQKGIRKFKDYNNSGLTFPWAEARARLGISDATFNRAIKKLIAVGFLDIERRGNKLTNEPTVYSLSSRWIIYDKPYYKPVEYEKIDVPAFRRYREKISAIKNDSGTAIKNDSGKGKRNKPSAIKNDSGNIRLVM